MAGIGGGGAGVGTGAGAGAGAGGTDEIVRGEEEQTESVNLFTFSSLQSAS